MISHFYFLLNGVVWCFIGNLNIVWVAFFKTCARDLDEFRLLLKGRDILAAAVSHRASQAA